jgi:hypothetical protein
MIAEAEEIVLFAKADTGHLKKLFVNAHAPTPREHTRAHAPGAYARPCALTLALAHARARTTTRRSIRTARRPSSCCRRTCQARLRS